jgi:fluoride ion exporter CrcB/FEX
MATFAVNVVGSVIYAILFVLKCKQEESNHTLAVTLIASLLSGFCGTLTTASTFTNELKDIRPMKWAYFYGAATIVVIQGFCLIILGVAKSSGVNLYIDDVS